MTSSVSSISAAANLTFQEKLANYARLTIRVGVGLQAGQRLLIQSPIETAELTRLLVREAYAAGAKFVDVCWSDEAVTLAHFEDGPEDSFAEISKWRVDALMENSKAGGAVLAIRAVDPNLLSHVDSQRITTSQRAFATYRKPYMQEVMTNRVNWNLISAPVAGWAKLMFPELTEEEAVKKQWDAIFAVTRADQTDPVAAWQTHIENLRHRRELLTGRQYDALHLKGGETNLVVGLADDHVWGGGVSETAAGIAFTPNIPTEEIFTAPHRERVDGIAVSTKPLSYNGVLIDGIRMRFEKGRVVEVSAKSGEKTLKELVATDEGSQRLGEVALVAHSSPISQSGLFFYNTLFDENAACHIAIGSAYRFNVHGGTEMTTEDFLAAGGNDSLTHVDWMIGHDKLDVDGITKDGSREAVMRDGEFVL